MKHTFIFLLALSAFCTFGQERNFDTYRHETSPVFPGCEEAKNRSDCYLMTISEAVRDKVNAYTKDIISVDLQIKLLLRNETNGTITILTLETDDAVAEKASREAIAALPLFKPQKVDGKVYVSSEGFYVNLHRNSATETFSLVPFKKDEKAANMPHPADIKRPAHVVFPGCEDAPRDELHACFSTNFNIWLSNRLSRKIIRKSAGQRVMLLLTFDEEGKLTEYEIKQSKSQELTDELNEIMKEFPHVLPAEEDGKKIPLKFGIPIRF